MLFKIRFQQDDAKERRAFVESLDFDWEMVTEEEKRELGENLIAASPALKRLDEENWFKVDWEKVPELVGRRNVCLRKGVAYVPLREQLSMILAEFTTRLEKALEVGGRSLVLPRPRLISTCHLAYKPSPTPTG
jgi:DNA primase large subunit